MGNSNNSTLILLQVLLQPVDRLRIEVVGRLVKQQHIRLLQQQTAKSHTATLTTRQNSYALIWIGTTQSIHRTLQHTVKLPAIHVVNLLIELTLTLDKSIHLVVGHWLTELHIDILILLQKSNGSCTALLDNLLYGLRVVELWLLLKVTHRVARCKYHLALIVLVDTCDNLHQGRFTRTVKTDDTDLRAVEE